MKENKQSIFVRLAEWIVDKRNLFFLIYAATIIFCVFSRGWVSVNTETKQGLTIMENHFTTFGSARVMVSNIILISNKK
jgi:hypothetical protein